MDEDRPSYQRCFRPVETRPVQNLNQNQATINCKMRFRRPVVALYGSETWFSSTVSPELLQLLRQACIPSASHFFSVISLNDVGTG